MHECKESKNRKIGDKKLCTPIALLCQGLPPEFAIALHYARSLSFEASPDYKFLRGLFLSLYQRSGFKLDGAFDWMTAAAGGANSASESNSKKSASAHHGAAHVVIP
jgi:hypothetical protein